MAEERGSTRIDVDRAARRPRQRGGGGGSRGWAEAGPAAVAAEEEELRALLPLLEPEGPVVLDEEEQERVVEVLRRQDARSTRRFQVGQAMVGVGLAFGYAWLATRAAGTRAMLLAGGGGVVLGTSLLVLLQPSSLQQQPPRARSRSGWGVAGLGLLALGGLVGVARDEWHLGDLGDRTPLLRLVAALPLVWVGLVGVVARGMMWHTAQALTRLEGQRYRLKGA